MHDDHQRPTFNQRTHSSPHGVTKKTGGEHQEFAEKTQHQDASKSLADAEAKLNNPLADYSASELVEMGKRFAIEQDLADLTAMQRRVHSKRGMGKFGFGRKKRLDNMTNTTATGMKQAGDMVDASDDERRKHGEALWGKAALVAQNPLAFEGMEGLTESDREALRHEQTHSEFRGSVGPPGRDANAAFLGVEWDQTSTLYSLVVMCSVAAAVQGQQKLLRILLMLILS